jgi:hypothetical protein
MTSQSTIGLALGGGAARGLAHIVVLEAVAYSGFIRPLIPKVSGHPFQFYQAIDFGASGHPLI